MHRKGCAGFFQAGLIMFVLLFSSLITAQEEPWIDSFPTVDEVLAKTVGRNQMDELAREEASFYVLSLILKTKRADMLSPLPPKSKEKLKDYKEALDAVRGEATRLYKEQEYWSEYYNKVSSYEGTDRNFQLEVVERFVPDEYATLRIEWNKDKAYVSNIDTGPGFLDNLGYYIDTFSGTFIGTYSVIFFASIIFALVARSLNKLIFGNTIPYDKTNGSGSSLTRIGGSNYFQSSGGLPSEAEAAGGAACIFPLIFGFIGFMTGAFDGSGIDRLFMVLSIPAIGVATFYGWRLIKYLVLLGCVGFGLFAIFDFVVNGL